MARVERPVAPGDERTFQLSYVREGPRSDRPLLVVPGGPGLASVLPYSSFRASAAGRGVDVVMVEHRGVGLSRQDADGVDLPPEALTVDQVVDDLAAVLDDCGVDQAVVYGSSYGTYLAQGLGVRHPERVAGMVLDSVMLGAHDGQVVRESLRDLYWHGRSSQTARAAELMRRAVAAGVVPVETTGAVTQIVHEFAGPAALERLLRLRLDGRGRWIWNRLAHLGADEITTGKPLFMEPDLVGRIAYGELGYAPVPDGLPLDVRLEFAASAADQPPFTGEPFHLATELPRFRWPLAVISGDRDVRTPRAIAEQVVDLAPDAVLVPLTATGHSALDTHRRAALQVAEAVLSGHHRTLPEWAAELSSLPRRGPTRLLGHAIRTAIGVRQLLPRTPARTRADGVRDTTER
ncbi:alpha/beta fold hydrolase [Blastococcus sp. SYSU DS0619]